MKTFKNILLSCLALVFFGGALFSSTSSSYSDSSDESEVLYCQYSGCGVVLHATRQSQYCSRACRLRASTRLFTVSEAAPSPVGLVPAAHVQQCSDCGYYLPAGTVCDYCDDCFAEREKQTHISFDQPIAPPLPSDGSATREGEVVVFSCKWCGVAMPTGDYGLYCSDYCTEQDHEPGQPLADECAQSAEEKDILELRPIECLVCRSHYSGACPHGHEIIWIPDDRTNQIIKIQ
jgi:hypothetical protein